MDIKDKQTFANPLYLKQLFGAKAYAKLQALFNPCCSELNPCCPTEKYTIEQIFVSCSSSSITTYKFNISTLIDLEGFLGFSVYWKLSSATNWSAKSFSGSATGITINTGFTTINSDFNENLAINVVIIDSRGNWSNIISFTTANCP